MSTDEDYDPANSDNYDDDKDDDDDEEDVITPSNLSLMTETSSSFVHHVDTKPAGCMDTFGPEEPTTLNIH